MSLSIKFRTISCIPYIDMMKLKEGKQGNAEQRECDTLI